MSPISKTDFFNGSNPLDTITTANLGLNGQRLVPAQNDIYRSAVQLRKPVEGEKKPTDLFIQYPKCEPFLICARNKIDEVLTYPFRKNPFLEPFVAFSTAAFWNKTYPYSIGDTFEHGLYYRYQLTSTHPLDFYFTEPLEMFVSGGAKMIPMGKVEKPVEAFGRMVDWHRERDEALASGKDLLTDPMFNDTALVNLPSFGFPKAMEPDKIGFFAQDLSFGLATYLTLGFKATLPMGFARTLPNPTQGNLIREPIVVFRDGKKETIYPDYKVPISRDAQGVHLADLCNLDLRVRFGPPTGLGIGAGLKFQYLNYSDDTLDPTTHQPLQRVMPYLDGFFSY